MKKLTVLFVDDEVEILHALKRQLRGESFEILLAQGCVKAREILSERDIHIIISDQRMPDMTGVEFFQEVKVTHPLTVRVILSGYADSDTIIDSINRGEVFRYLSKPWSKEELVKTIRQAEEHYFEMLKKADYVEDIMNRHDTCQIEKVYSDTKLRMTLEILEGLTMPVFAVDKEDKIAFLNDHAARELTTRFNIQKDVTLSDIFGSASADEINRGFLSGREDVVISMEDHGLMLNLCPMDDSKLLKGVIYTTEKKGD